LLQKEIFGWWYGSSIDSDMLEALRSMFFTGLILIPDEMTLDEMAGAAKTLAENGMKWGAFRSVLSDSYDGLVYWWTQYRDTLDSISPKPSWFCLDDFQNYVYYGNYNDAVRAANEVFGEDRYYINYNLELFNSHPHEMHPEVYIKHVDYYDTPENTLTWLEYEVENNWSHKTLGAMVWTKTVVGCGWNNMTEDLLRQLYQLFISLGCVRNSFWNFYPTEDQGTPYNNLLNDENREWWPLVRELNLLFLGNPRWEFMRQLEKFGEPVTVQRRYRTGTDDYGDPVYSWDYFLTEKIIVKPLKGNEAYVSAGKYTHEDMKAYLSPITQIRQGDRVVIDDEYYSVDFLAVRKAAGRPHHCEAVLKRVTE